MKYCPYCGAGLEEDMRFCPKCGKPFEDGKANPHLDGKTPEPETASPAPAMSSPTPAAAPSPAPRKKRSGLIAGIISAVVLAIVGFFIAVGILSDKPFSEDTESISHAAQSVVMLYCYDKDGELIATGSGFAAFEKGTFISNYHVISGEVFSIIAKTEDGHEYSISNVDAYSIISDIAIISTESGEGIEPLLLGDSSLLKKGEKVTAIGSPLGLINTVSTGVYSGMVDDEQPYLQFSAPVSHGSSGGALFNNRGEVIGITSASLESGQNINLAVPIETAIQMWDARFKSTSISLKKFYALQDHLVSIDDLFDDIGFYSSKDAPKKITVEGYVFEINKAEKTIVLANSFNEEDKPVESVIFTNIGSLLMDGVTIGEHVCISGKNVVPLQSDAVLIDGSLATINPIK